MVNFLCPCNRLLIDFNFSTFHTSLKFSPDARIWYSIGGSKDRYIPLSIISLHIRRCKGKLGLQNFWPNWQEYQFSIWLAKNTPPLPRNESWPELGTLSFDYPRIPSPPENWNLGRSWHFELWLLKNIPPPLSNLARSWYFEWKIEIEPRTYVETNVCIPRGYYLVF